MSIGSFLTRKRRPPRDLRLRMIDETSAFLTWALAEERQVPRIPCRRVDDGGFEALLARPGARALARRWWGNVLNI
ncbi:MAG: hypothetical protein WD042_13650 [Phycisphaeraceae bacterium]